MEISTIPRCQSSQWEGLWGSAILASLPRKDTIVGVKAPDFIDLPTAPRCPSAPASSFRLLSAGESSDFPIDLPPHDGQVSTCVPPLEVVHPSSHARIHDLPNHRCDWKMEAPPQDSLQFTKESRALLHLRSGEDRLVARCSKAGDPAKFVTEEVKRISRGNLDDLGFVFVDG